MRCPGPISADQRPDHSAGTCAAGFVLPRMPSTALSTEHSNFGSSVSWGPPRAAAPGGKYRLCWCAAPSKCSSPTEYVVNSGELRMIGPNLYQLRQCYPGGVCSSDNFVAYGLQGSPKLSWNFVGWDPEYLAFQMVQCQIWLSEMAI